MVLRYKSDVNGLGLRLPFFEPEKISFAITKTFQLWVSVFVLVVYKSCDPQWLQSLGIESDRTLKVTDCENDVVDHIFLNYSFWPIKNFLINFRRYGNQCERVCSRSSAEAGCGAALDGAARDGSAVRHAEQKPP